MPSPHTPFLEVTVFLDYLVLNLFKVLWTTFIAVKARPHGAYFLEALSEKAPLRPLKYV